MVPRLLAACLLALAVTACNDDGRTLAPAPTTAPLAPDSIVPGVPEVDERFSLTSPAFVDRSPMPVRFTCAGDDIIPPLRIRGVPSDAVELALVIDDADANGFIHFIAAGMAPDLTEIEEGVVPPDAVVLFNGFDQASYDGPCPPEGSGEHRYLFTLYALREPSFLDQETPAFDARLVFAERSSAIAVLEGRFSADQA